MHELERVLERQVREFAGSVLGQPRAPANNPEQGERSFKVFDRTVELSVMTERDRRAAVHSERRNPIRKAGPSGVSNTVTRRVSPTHPTPSSR